MDVSDMIFTAITRMIVLLFLAEQPYIAFMSKKTFPSAFGGLGIAPGLLAALARLKFTEPTPIQQRSIPVGMEGKVPRPGPGGGRDPASPTGLALVCVVAGRGFGGGLRTLSDHQNALDSAPG